MLRELFIHAAPLFGATLPPAVFFRPTLKFVKWMAETWDGRMVYDVGAGCGLASKALADAGLFVKAIDICHRDRAEFEVKIADGTAYRYDRQSTVMLCRPCHGPFAQAVIERAVECKARRVLYVGLPRNVKGDLGAYRKRFRRVLGRAGKDGECVYEME